MAKSFDKLVNKLKKHPSKISNPYALARYIQKNKGAECAEISDAEIKKYTEDLKNERIRPADKKTGKETNAIGTNAQLTKPAKNIESKSSSLQLRTHFIEAEANDAGRSVPVIIIQEGLGNLKDRHFYTKTALEKSYARFNGAQCYADHPGKTEEADRPERTIRDLIGYYVNPEITNLDGKTAIKATLKIFDGDAYGWAWDLVKEALAFAKLFPDKDLVGISINANGVTHQEQDEQQQITHYVDEITEVNSSDMVTRAGAGGKIGADIREAVAAVTQAKAKHHPEVKKLMKKALEKIAGELEAIKANCEGGKVEAAALPDVINELIEQLKQLADQAPEGTDTADEEAKKKAAEAEAKAKADAAAAAAAAPAATSPADQKESAALKAVTDENILLKETLKLRDSAAMVEKLLKESHLPAGTYDGLRLVLIGKDEAYAKKLIEAKKQEIAAVLGLKAKATGNGEMVFTEGTSGKTTAGIFDGIPRVETKK